MLTDTKCRNAAPKEKAYKLTDSHGLYLEVKPNGVKSWRYRFELGGKESVFAIGNYEPARLGESKDQADQRRAGGRLTLAEAREERAKARDLVRQGKNPSQQRKLARIQRQHENAQTFVAVAKEWLSVKDWEDETKKRRLRMLERVVFPSIGALPVREIKPLHVLEVLKTAAQVNGLSVAAEAKRTMSGVFELAVATLRADTDPVYPVRRSIPPNKTQHKRALTADEIGRLLRDFDAHGGRHETIAAFKLMWLTLCRPSEATGVRWEEVDLDAGLWRIAQQRTKKRREHLVPLPRQAVELLEAMKGINGKRAHVFPGRDNKNESITIESFRQALKVLGWNGKYSPHATRTTGSTRLNEMGFQVDWIERQLAHLDPNPVRRTYNHADYLPARSEMMQKWADYLDELQQQATKKGEGHGTKI